MAAFAATCSRRLRRRAADDDGFGLVELLIAMTMLSIAVGALLAVFTSSAVSLRRAGQKGTALTLADTQMEKYRTRTFTAVRIDGTLIPTSGTYVTANSTDSTIPPSTNQAVAGQNGDEPCSTVDEPAACLPVQNVTGPDGHTYRDRHVRELRQQRRDALGPDACVGSQPETRDRRRPGRLDRGNHGPRVFRVRGLSIVGCQAHHGRCR